MMHVPPWIWFLVGILIVVAIIVLAAGHITID